MLWLRRHRLALGLALILVIGAALRFYGLNWDQNHHLHPDERAIVAFVVPKIGMPPFREWPRFFNPLLAREATEEQPNFFAPQTSPLNPHFFAYGSLPLYLLRFVANLLSLLVPLSHFFASWPSLAGALATLGRPSDYEYLTILGRALAALAGTANIYLAYLVGKRAYSQGVGLLAATFSAFIVFEIQVSHFFAVDIFLNLFVLLVLYFALGLAQGGGKGEAALLGASFGWALATKFSAAPLGLVVLSALVIRHWRGKDKGWREVIFLALLALLCLALAFFFTQPYAILDWKSFWERVVAEGEMARGIRDYPYTRQYAGTTPYVYQITQTTIWAMGPALGVMAWGGLLFALWRAIRHRQPSEILLLVWVVPYFLVTGSFYVKFLRYMLPLFPILYLMGANMLLSLRERFTGRAAQCAWRMVMGLVVALSLLYSLAFVTIYTRPHSRVQVSEWIYENIPPGSILALEHWDDNLPLGIVMDGEARSIGEYKTVTMELYEPDNEAKYEKMKDNLQAADYVILSSNRLYGSIPRLPQRYPITTRYYELLFGERLGFRLIKALTSYPGLLGFTIVDDYADESFTVYDHPKVLIFQKERDLADEEFDRLFAQSLLPSEPERMVGKSLLLEEPVDELPVIRDRGWNRLANSHPLLSILFWWLAVEILGLVALPLTLLIFRNLADGGYVLSKTLGLLVVGYLVWLAASLRLFTNSLPTILGAGLLLGLISFGLIMRGRREILTPLSSRKKVIFISEAIFSGAFLLFVAIRFLNPDLWQPWNGGEKSMEFAYLNAIVKSPYFPPYDPYFAGGYINYYYYGLHLVSVLIKLTGVFPPVAFNLAIPTLFALTVGNAFSLGYNLTRRYLVGVMVPVFLTLLGNLDGLVQIVERLGDLGGLQFRSSIPGLEGLVRAIPGLAQLLLGRGALVPFDYWRSTRVIPFTINEFPFFSFLFADLHPHMIGIPFTILLLALAFSVLRKGEPSEGKAFGLHWYLLLLTLALSLGAVATVNTWDLPTYFLIILGVFSLQAWEEGGWAAMGKALLASLALAIGGLILYLPFFSHYQPLYVGVGLVKQRTEWEPFIIIWGLFLFLGGSYLLLRVVQKMGRNALLAFGLLGLSSLLFLLLREAVLAILFPLVLLASLLVLVERYQPERRFAHLLFFLGLGILLGCEVVYMRDFLQGGEYQRMNTLFKFYTQAWVLLSVAGAVVLPHLWRGLAWRRLWQGAFLALFLASTIYTVLGTQARVRDRFPGARPPLGTLDGLAFMTVGRYTWPDESNPIELRYDYEAIQWFLANVEGTPVVAEAPLPYYREGGLKVASYTGLPTLVGAHQNEQRYGWMVAERETEARSLYESADLEETKALIEELDVTYIYVGQLEQTVYPARSLAKFDALLEEGYLELAYENSRVRVYKVKG